MFLKRALICSLTIAVIGCAGVTGGAQADPIQRYSSGAIWFENWGGLSHAVLVVVAPDGKATRIESSSKAPVFQLQGRPLDGTYSYELTAATDQKRPVADPVDNGRGGPLPTTETVPFSMTGHFVVSRGVIVEPEDIPEIPQDR